MSSITSAAVNLDTIVQDYLGDTAYQQAQQAIIKQRDESIPVYKDIIARFTAGNSDLEAFRNELKILHKDKFWRASGPGFLMELNKLASNHLPSNREVEANIRFILTGLNAQNVGQRIQQFYALLVKEKERLSQVGTPHSMIVSPGNSAFIISLFAFWLDRQGQPYIYYPSTRLGLAALINAKLIPIPAEIHFEPKGIEIISDADHQAVSQTLNNLGAIAPQLKNDSYWAGRFLRWITDQVKTNPTYLKNTYIFLDSEETLESDSDELIEQISLPYELIEDAPLVPVPEPQLTRRIAQLRRHIFVEEALVRRIYQALLNGHVILTGPPGTGKTELARLIPELLWQSDDHGTRTAYTTTLTTATNDWSTRTLISSIAPVLKNEKISYRPQPGHLTAAIMKNWAITTTSYPSNNWKIHGRMKLQAESVFSPDTMQEFHGHWLIIDEFNRAPIDAAFGEALTALSNGEALSVPVEGDFIRLPLPKDFRIIGTLNSFDRNYLNQISEALKRRFAFIEVSPPSRVHRQAEQNIILYKALKFSSHLSDTIIIDGDVVTWQNIVSIGPDASGVYDSIWDRADHPFRTVFYNVMWPLFEVIRIYRQLGTAQAITLTRQMLTPGILQDYTTEEQWWGALDIALCDTIADQLQVLLPDELEVLLWYLKLDAHSFINKYNEVLVTRKPRRLAAHLEALSAIVDENGHPYLTDEQVEQLLEQENPEELRVAPEPLIEIFHLDHPPFRLPQIARRLRTFKAERGL